MLLAAVSIVLLIARVNVANLWLASSPSTRDPAPGRPVGGRLVAAGLIAGGLVTLSLSNAANRFLFGLDPRDPRAYAVAMITLLAAAFVATLLPARRAASVDPTRALQQE